MRHLVTALNILPNAVLWGNPETSEGFAVILPETAADAMRAIATGPEVESVILTISLALPFPFRWCVAVVDGRIRIHQMAICNAPGGRA
jgi:hypothetical protein